MPDAPLAVRPRPPRAVRPRPPRAVAFASFRAFATAATATTAVARLAGLVVALIALAPLVAAGGCGPGLTSGSRPLPDKRFDFAHGINVYETSNGMQFALVRDRRTNLATIDVRYDVGAASDPAGKEGLAHLVEHLMFELRPSPDQPTLGAQLDQLALATNAHTLWDETHYTSTVPIERLADALSLEALRMRAPCDWLDDAHLERERDIVLAEEAERASPTVDLVYQLHALAFGADHPYARRVGSSAIATATRADVCAFITEHYAPVNAYLVVTGPFELDEVRALVGRTFGPVPARVTVLRPDIAPPIFTGDELRASAPLAHPAAVVMFALPRWGSGGALCYQLGARLLAGQLEIADGQQPWIVGAGAMILGGPRAPLLVAYVEVATPERLESAADEVFRRAARLRDLSNFDAVPLVSEVLLDEMTRWDDLLGRGSWIADYLQYSEHRWFMLDDLRTAAEGWESGRAEVAEALRPEHARIVLFERGMVAHRAGLAAARPSATHELATWRAAVDPAEADRPLELQAATPVVGVRSYRLANGLRVILAHDPSSPIVDVRMIFPAGTAQQPTDQPLLAIAAALLLGPPPAPRLAPGRHMLWRSPIDGARVAGTDVDESATTFTIRGLAEASDRFLAELDDHLRKGVYDASLLERVRKNARDADRDNAATEDETVADADLRFRERLFGAGHPYAAAATAYAPALAALDVRELQAWRRDRFRASGATLVVSGRFDTVAYERELVERFGAWSAEPPPPPPLVPATTLSSSPSWLAVEAPRAQQLAVRIGFGVGADERGIEALAARRVVREMVLDQVRELREGLGATYGLEAEYLGGVAGSALVVSGLIEERKAGLAVPRLLAALARLRDDDATRREAFVRARRKTLGLVQARVAGASTMASELAGAIELGEDEQFLDRAAAAVAALRYDDVRARLVAALDDRHRVVEVRGRRGPVTGVFATLAVKPEWLYGSDDDEGEPGERADGEARTASASTTDRTDRTDRGDGDRSTARPRPPAPAPRDAPAEPAIDPATVAAKRLAVGDPDSVHGPHDRGVYRGGSRISLGEFLRVSGHGELAGEIRWRRRARLGLMAFGFGAAVASLVYGVASLEDCPPLGTVEAEECRQRNHGDKQVILVGVVGGGLIGLAGSQLGSGVPSDATLRRYADEYNYTLDRGARTASAPAPRAVTVEPAVGPGAVGLTVTGRF
jgi:zinc protease